MGSVNHDKSSGVDRTSSLRASARLSGTHEHVIDGDDDDSYALAAAMGISDGFRPAEATQNHGRPNPSAATSSNPQFLPPHIESPRPSSVSKGHRPRESLTLRHDGDRPSVDVANESPPARVASVTSVPGTSRFSRTDAATNENLPGPSHPYEMYQQNVRLARTASLATASTAPISERSYNGPRGPTHPYGMYPQTMVPEVEESPTTPSAIPVGFLGTVDNYQRRLGPDGEDAADLIGPDGHTEQLPPYTRYPEETYQRKALGMSTPQPVPVQNLQPIPGAGGTASGAGSTIPGAGGIGLATRNPEFSSTDELDVANSPIARQSVRSFGSEASHHEINTAALTAANEKEAPSGWRAAARRRVWGVVPCWAIGLVVVVLVLLGGVIGAVLGTVVGSKLSDDSEKSTPVMTFPYDSHPLSTVPPGLPPLVEGTYQMPLMLQRSPDVCFDDPTQTGAWNCNLLYADLCLTVRPRPDESETSNYSFEFSYNAKRTLDQDVYAYGMQPPSTSNPLKLRLVEDSLEPDRGPAWSFRTLYNKTVIIPEEYLEADGNRSETKRFHRRDFVFGGDVHRKGVAKPGEKPWVCYWESTLLETFIYATQNNSFERVNSVLPSATSSRSAQSSSIRPKQTDGSEGSADKGELRTSTRTSSPPASSTVDYFDSLPTPTENAQVYPRVVKVMERRIPGFASVDPWCRQFEILPDGNSVAVLDERGHEVQIRIKETEGDLDYENSEEDSIDSSSGSSSSESMSDCGCLWWLT
ncbi:hypothetical protein DL764_007419 [Monosporascus ibericus]|uniref:DUF7820 domain-containing protein n=1 Tax=Monosporascus ibericus TaxID=155417 RepID=A0A4Q4T0S0_9PEZI|nr:hypothetical protein DL764_007419 [Monosporascus ibericus]